MFLIQASGLSASLITQDEKNNDTSPDDLETQYNSILNGEIENIDLLCFCLSTQPKAK